MPYIEVWVDAEDFDCPSCEECAAREAKEDEFIPEIMRERLFTRERGDYERFERFLQSVDPSEWQTIFYGPSLTPRQPEGPPRVSDGGPSVAGP